MWTRNFSCEYHENVMSNWTKNKKKLNKLFFSFYEEMRLYKLMVVYKNFEFLKQFAWIQYQNF